MISWAHITMFGDTVVMLPAAAAIFGWLAIGRAWRLAFWWGFLFLLGFFFVLATKVAFIGWGIGSEALEFTGFLLGTVIALGFIRMAEMQARPHFNRWLVALSMCALIPTSYAEPAPTNNWVNAIALYLSGHDKPYVRHFGRQARPVFAQQKTMQQTTLSTALPTGVRRQIETE